MSYTSVWAATTFGLGAQGVAMLYVVSGIAGAIGNPLIGLYSDRLRLRRPFVVGQLIVCALVLLVAAHRAVARPDPAMAAAG